MKKTIIITLIACLAIVGPASPVRAQSVPKMVTMDEALTVAQNWITLIIQKKGDWGGFETAEVEEIQEFKRGERVLGYFCSVKPQGFIVISLRRELAPVKAYSAVSNLDPESDEGIADIIKGGMERVLNAIEAQIGPLESVRTKDLENILEINYRQSWEELEGDAVAFKQQLGSGVMAMDYQAGNPLLSSNWHQGDPYNALCPTGHTGCTNCCPGEPQPCNPTLPTAVGCVATAGAQIMKYWAWPPSGSVESHSSTWDGDDSCGGNVGGGTLSATLSDPYEWRNMADDYVWNPWLNRWQDENGDPLTQAHLDAVAELCYEVGVVVGMDYGVCGSGADTSNMEGVYENYYRYSTNCNVKYRKDYDSAIEWFNRIKSDLNANRPLQYKVPGHSIVVDGWQELGSTPTRQYHMNYGWAGWVPPNNPDWASYTNSNTWYTLDALPGSNRDEEDLIEDIYPAPILWGSLSGTYIQPPFPYRYFTQDATGSSATFQSGQNLQFLPGIVVACTSTTGGSIRFEGSSSDNTLLFTRGDTSQGVLIYNGTIKLNQGGSIKFP
jgi:hypothetical protein